MWGAFGRLVRDDRGAVAPTVALSLFALIGAGGIAFDYARLAAMDTELQDAADQAALAAATQLDRTDDAQTHAVAAISDPDEDNRLAQNFTRFANDNEGTSVELDDVTFCSDFDDDEPDTATACTETNDGADSRYVVVTTSVRTANYALTPIVAAFSGSISAQAVAGVESSICHIAPLFVCTNDTNFPSDSDIGKGLLMKTGAQNSWFPGNYGYLDFGPGNPAVIDALMGHGLNGCQKIDESNTQPGNKNATDAINTRFDVYGGTGATKDPTICTNLADGTGCPDQNTGKDLTRTMTYIVSQAKTLPAPTNTGKCGDAATAKNANPEISYTPFDPNNPNPAVQGMPRDTCHYSSSCAGGNFGNGTWDYAGFMAANHPGVDTSTVPKAGATPTRYEVYQWENAHQADALKTLDPLQIGPNTPKAGDPKITGQTATYTYTRVCAARKPVMAMGAAVEPRRILPVVAAQCDSLNGASNLDEFHAIRVFDVFLTEPSLNRTVAKGYAADRVTDDKEIYGEIIGPSQTLGGGAGFQYYSRNRPYLVR